MPVHRRAQQHRRGSAVGSTASLCWLPAHQDLEIWLQPILLPARSGSLPQTPAWGAGEKAAAATASRCCSAHPEVVCPSLPSSRIRLSGTSLTAWWEPQPAAKRLNVVGRKGRKSVSAPWDRGDDATWPKERVQESSAICCSSQFPAPCLSFPTCKIGAMVGAACKAFFETCCGKMLYNSKELLKPAAWPGPCLAQFPCVPPQDGAEPPGSKPARPSPPLQWVSGLL